MADVNPSPSSTPPSQTAHLILGLLSLGYELSGYELRLWAQRSVGAFYKPPAQSQIYKELGRLDEAGLVVSQAVKQDDNPDKIVYSLTDNGREALEEWVTSAPIVAPVLKHPVALQTAFSGGVDKEVLAHRLDQYIASTVDALGDLEDLIVGLSDPDQPELTTAVLQWAFAIRTGDLKGAKAVRVALGGAGR